jgi:hypothetical protein
MLKLTHNLRLVEKICRIVTSCVRRIDPVYICKFMVAADCMKFSWKNVMFEADLLSVYEDCVSLDWKSLHNRSGSFCNLSSVFKWRLTCSMSCEPGMRKDCSMQ